MLDSLVSLHTSLFFSLHSLVGQNATVDFIVYALSDGVGFALILAIFAVIVFREKEWRSRARHTFGTFFPILPALLYSELLKQLFQAPRPDYFFHDFEPLFEFGGFDSFPSGHATVYGALALSVFYYDRRLGVVAFAFALAISLARVISGVHWPIDILAGLLIGASFAYLFAKMSRASLKFKV
jgi:undecaprenyl-diphosphatase